MFPFLYTVKLNSLLRLRGSISINKSQYSVSILFINSNNAANTQLSKEEITVSQFCTITTQHKTLKTADLLSQSVSYWIYYSDLYLQTKQKIIDRGKFYLEAFSNFWRKLNKLNSICVNVTNIFQMKQLPILLDR